MKSLDSAPQAAAFNAERSDRTNNTSRSSGKNNRGDDEKSVRHYRGNWNFHHNKNNNKSFSQTSTPCQIFDGTHFAPVCRRRYEQDLPVVNIVESFAATSLNDATDSE